jgi:hypothetical protein
MVFKNKEYEYFLELLRAAINSASPAPAPVPEQVDWDRLFFLCRLHSVEGAVYYSVRDISMPDEIAQKFNKAYRQHSVREAVQSAEGELLMSEFEKNGIDNVFLKGYVLKKYYPAEVMRSMGDIDILFRQEQFAKMNECMISLGYKGSPLYNNQYHYKKPSGITVEMHNSLQNDGGDYFSNPWERFTKKSGTSHCYEMSNEDFYIYMILHSYRHFEKTGIGVRAAMDVYVYNKTFWNKLDFCRINSVLESCGAISFEINLKRLADCWFDGLEDSKGIQALSDFILSNGTFGSYSNLVATELKKGNNAPCAMVKLRYLFKKIFPPFSRLCAAYPILERHSTLLPFIWIARFIKLMLFKRRQVFAQLRIILKVKKTDIEKLNTLRKNEKGSMD